MCMSPAQSLQLPSYLLVGDQGVSRLASKNNLMSL